MTGKIIKGIAGFYYVHAENNKIYECKAKGVFRKQKIKPLVGDNVKLDVLDEKNQIGNLVEILPRKNQLIRPAVSNVDQALVVFAVINPKPNYNLLDKFLIMMEKQGIKTIICFNKKDIGDPTEMALLEHTYQKCSFRVLFSSALEEEGIQELEALLMNKTTVLAGPSGVGKSTVINLIYPEACMETGKLSEKLQRGKHTTRHSELFHTGHNTYLVDTPGFTSLSLEGIELDEMKQFFSEFEPYEGECRFQGCIHIHEPGCKVKEAVLDKKISKIRYENYVYLYEEQKEKRRY